MRRRQWINVIIVALGMISALSTSAQAASPSSPLCQTGEVTLWQCGFKNGKSSAVCASPTLTETEGYLQYRFGTSSKQEIQFPESRTDTQRQFRYWQQAYTRSSPPTDHAELSFTREGYTYTLLYEEADGDNLTQAQTVEATGKKTQFISCQNQPKDISITDTIFWDRLGKLSWINAQ